MSTVVGTCTDCIVSVPNANPLSLKYTVEVQQGINRLIKNRGTVSGYYPANDQSVQYLVIAAAGSYSPNASTTSLVISTDIPLQVTITRQLASTTFNVNQLLILDDTVTSFLITNPSVTTVANVFVAFTANP